MKDISCKEKKHRLWKTLSSVQFNLGQLRKKIYLFLYIDHMSHLNACSCALTVKAIPFTIFNNTLIFILMTCITILFIWLQFFEFCNRKNIQWSYTFRKTEGRNYLLALEVSPQAFALASASSYMATLSASKFTRLLPPIMGAGLCPLGSGLR